jgi:hypothetical protein
MVPLIAQKTINMRLSASILSRGQVDRSSSNDQQTGLGALSANIHNSSPVIMQHDSDLKDDRTLIPEGRLFLLHM